MTFISVDLRDINCLLRSVIAIERQRNLLLEIGDILPCSPPPPRITDRLRFLELRLRNAPRGARIKIDIEPFVGEHAVMEELEGTQAGLISEEEGKRLLSYIRGCEPGDWEMEAEAGE